MLDTDRLRRALASVDGLPREDCPTAETLWKVAHGEVILHERQAVIDHVAECPLCAEAWRLAVSMDDLGRAESKPAPTKVRFLHPGLAAACAAGISLLVLGYPAYLGLRALPSAERMVAELREENAATRRWTEDKIQHVLAEFDAKVATLKIGSPVGVLAPNFPRAVRGTEAPCRIHVGSEPTVLLALGTDVFDSQPESVQFLFEVREGSRTVWSTEVSGRDVRKSLEDRLGALLLSVPAEVLPAGRLDIQVSTSDGPLRVKVWEAPLEVIRESGRGR